MDNFQAQRIGEQLACAISDGMQNGFEHMPVAEPAPPEITLRDFFAGCALIGMLMQGEYTKAHETFPFRIADDMLKAREKT